MGKEILDYQRACNLTLDNLKSEQEVLAVLIHGSMLTGDIWEGSDIDMFVVIDEESNNIKHIYAEENEISIHLKILSKGKFISICEEGVKGAYIHRILSSSRLMFSKDRQITEVYDRVRYFPDLEREKWNIVYLGKLLKDMNECRKYLTNDSIHTAYSMAVMAVRSFSKFYVNLSGYMINRDVVTTTLGLNNTFSEYVEELFINNTDKEECINTILKYMEEYVEVNLKRATNVLIEFLKEKNVALSSEEIKCDMFFDGFDIKMEEILGLLTEKAVVKKDIREFKFNAGTVIKEKVYFI